MSRKSLIIFLLISCEFFVHGLAYEKQENEPCVRTHDKSDGICKFYNECPEARREYFHQGIQPTICGHKGIYRFPIVCCPVEKKRISVDKCSEFGKLTNMATPYFENKLMNFIFGGQITKTGEFPHMAAIGLRTIDDTVEFLCGGSLISERFVLTAAHCSRTRSGFEPSFVRLGDQNINSKNDGVTEIDVDIQEFIKHEKYKSNSFYYDVAVIRLSRNVEFTTFIRPACLWQDPTLKATEVLATGWGKTKEKRTSDELMKVQLWLIDNANCNDYIEDEKYLPDGIVDEQICAGVLAGGKDTCNGDSGGPIQVSDENNPNLYYIVGVTSFGSTFCGIKDTLGVYTRVSSYLDWIEEKVWE